MVRLAARARFRFLPFFSAGCALALAVQTACLADDPTVEITSDTPAYCEHLHERVLAMVHAAPAMPPQEVADLLVEGQRMCDHGLARGGIMRLRRAIAIMNHPEQEP